MDNGFLGWLLHPSHVKMEENFVKIQLGNSYESEIAVRDIKNFQGWDYNCQREKLRRKLARNFKILQNVMSKTHRRLIRNPK